MGSSTSRCEDELPPCAPSGLPVRAPTHPRSSSSRTRSEPDEEPEGVEEHDSFSRKLRTFRNHIEDYDFWSKEHLDMEPTIGRAVLELRRYFEDWALARRDDFWQRKSHQTVLAVVICRCSDGTRTVHRGMNTEVSLPAGSLCAERAAIASAAAMFQAAHEIEAVAVMDPSNQNNPLWPCEVCQSWFTKLRDQSAAIRIVAVSSPRCQSAAVRVNGRLLPPPRPATPPPSDLVNLIELAEGTTEWPWQSQKLVYVDGAWASLDAEQRRLLKEARARGTHLLVGIHSDDTLREEVDERVEEDFETRRGQVLDNRHVSSVLRDAPWCVTREMIADLGIDCVVMGPKHAPQIWEDQQQGQGVPPPYQVAQDLGVLAAMTPQGIQCVERMIKGLL